MEGDSAARRAKRRESIDRRMDPMKPDTPFSGYYRLSSRAGRRAGGSPTADKVMRMAFGFAAGLALSAPLVLGWPENLEFSKSQVVNVPFVIFGFLGFPIGVVLSPIGLWVTRKQQSPKYLLRGGFAVGFLAGLLLSMMRA